MKTKIGILLFVSSFLTLSFLPHEKESITEVSPNNLVIEWALEKHTRLKNEMQQFHTLLLDEHIAAPKIQSAFHQLKRDFKEIEFLYYYLDPQTFSVSINGAPLPKLMDKVPDMTIILPKGFQRIEELVYENEERDALIDQALQLSNALEGYNGLLLSKKYVSDAVIFESLRYGIIRINTMGISGFDAPVNAEESLKDAAMFFKSLETIFGFYATYIPEKTLDDVNEKIRSAVVVLNESSFDSFDRFHFIRDVLNPLWKSSLAIQRQLNIELPHQRFNKLKRPVNYEAESLYAENFLKKDYYADFLGEDLEEKITLGKQLFFDTRLSKSNTHSCASCHNPKLAFTDGLKLSKNLTDGGPGQRNSPSLINAVYADRYFHDMRVDRLSIQMDHVVLNPIEFNIRYDTIINRLSKDASLSDQFFAVYGPERITKNTITNAMSSFVASLTSSKSPFDLAIRGESKEDDLELIQGFNLFMGKAACATCHFPPTFSGLLPPGYTENESEVLGVPASPEAPFLMDNDLGRYMNHLLKEQAPFYKHSFKTPTVRNSGLTAPYMHNGVYQTLEEVIDFYDVGGGIGLGIPVPNQTLPSDSLHLSTREKEQLIYFLKTLNDADRFEH